jgi:hypothetical protein
MKRIRSRTLLVLMHWYVAITMIGPDRDKLTAIRLIRPIMHLNANQPHVVQ